MARRNDTESKLKDFIAFKSARSLQIKPQTPRGWWTGLIWTLILLAPSVPLVMLTAWVDETPQEIWVLYAVLPHLLLTGLIAWAMIRWMMARAEIMQRDEKGNWVSNSTSKGDRTRR
jgi:uncharacterized membrane protein YhaH (DUF805 family)